MQEKGKRKDSTIMMFTSVIIIPLLTICFSFYSSEKQNSIEKEQTKPLFFLEKESSLSKKNIKIINKGGRVTYFKFEHKTEISLTFHRKMMTLHISYYDRNRLHNIDSNIENKNVWYYEPILDDIDVKTLQNHLRNRIDSLFVNSDDIYLSIEDYYELNYRDYENVSNTIYFTLDGNGRGVYYNHDDEYNIDVVSAGGMTSLGYEDVDSLYESVTRVVTDEILHFRLYDEVYHENNY